MRELIERLIYQPGVSGYETPVRDFIAEEVRKFASIAIDPIGNITASVGSGHPWILFASHMDEIGMIVGHIEDNGFLRIRKVGMLDDRLLVGRVVEIITDNGKVPGVIGIRPPHLMTSLAEFEHRRDVPTWDNILIDVGTSSRKETVSLGISVMAPVIFKKDFNVLNENRYVARSLDDRFGCALLIKVLKEIVRANPDRKITFAWTVQEEIGAIGGCALSQNHACDVMIAVDAYSSADVPGVPLHYGPSYLGQGPILRIMDHHSISTPALCRWVIALAKKKGIPLQVGPTGGYTDGRHFLSKGIPMLMLAVPMRYTHSPAEMIDKRDLDGLFKLLINIIQADRTELAGIVCTKEIGKEISKQ